ncbi:MAG: molybdopterin-dependent oxidoreductase [Mesorhizobium sp.]|nr:molybdopterin cofactor-binding domain-containing protein [Mesorhizobium sp.]MBL8576503.1 molybdopterin-dependent oxidoreductase [Mesorhizobium sp.]
MLVLHPSTSEEALELAAGDEDTYFLGGGTLAQLDWAMGLRLTDRAIALGRIVTLQGIDVGSDFVRIGALTTLAAIEHNRTVADALPMLLAAIKVTAAPSVRNIGTIGGNVGGRRGCLIPVLLAMDAQLEIVRPGARQRISLVNWLGTLRDPDCLIEAIVVPRLPAPTRWTYRKTGLRAGFTPGVIGIAGSLLMAGDRIEDCRIAVGGGVTAMRHFEVEALLKGELLEAVDWSHVHTELMEAIKAPTDPQRSTSYRRRVAANALVHGLTGRLPGTSGNRNRPLLSPPTGPVEEIRLGRGPSGRHWHTRPDGPAKIAGRLTYLTDVREEGMLVGRVLRPKMPHAYIGHISTKRAEALPGVVAVVTHRDVKGSNGFGIVVQDQPAMCFDKVRYTGDAIAAVAAVNAEVAERALKLIRLRYKPVPVVSDAKAALEPGAPAVHASGNLQREIHFERGNIEDAFARAAHVVEATYRTPRQMHTFMETEGGYAYVSDDGTLNVCAGGQHGRRDQMQLARILGLPEDKIRIVSSPTGGAFGGKDELTVQPALALLALKTGRPVRMQLERAESVRAGTKSNPMTIRMRTACDAEGRLVAQQVDLLSDSGAYASLSPGVLETALEHACGPYDVANVEAHARLAYTNNGAGGAFRGFGCNQMSYALECQVERLAVACGLDSIAFRARNMRKAGTRGYLGQAVAPTERLSEMLDAAAADAIWKMPRGLSEDGTEFIGIGMGMNYQGNGLGTLPPDPGGGALRLARDGKIEAAYGLDEIGQGLLAAIRNTVAAELGCGHDDIRPLTGDTATSPESGSTTASRGTYVVWRVARDAAPNLAEQIKISAASILDRDPDSLVIVPGGVADRASNSGEILLSFADLAAALPEGERPVAETEFEFPKSDYFDGNARLIFAFGATLARVAVDRVSGHVRVLDISQHTAAGPVLDHAAYLGQIEGASVQGLGFTTLENSLLESGKYFTWNLDGYMIPSIRDAPQSMAVFAHEGLASDDTFGPRGIGELGIGAVTPAIANAVADAIGYWPERAPFDPERILEAMSRPS